MYTVEKWFNSHIALVETDENLDLRSEITIPSKDINTDSFLKRGKIKVGKFLTPDNEYFNVHLEKEELKAEVINKVDDNKYIVDVKYTIKSYT